MKKKTFVIITSAILALGIATTVYAKNKSDLSNFKGSGTMMLNNNINSNDNYDNMINLMKQNGFEDAANAMESRDYDAMYNIMSNLTNDEFNQMIDIMNNNGYGDMARRMSSLGKQGMVNMHNSMMRR